MAKGKKKAAKNNGKATDSAEVEGAPAPEETGPQEPVNDDDAHADGLVVVEVFEVRTHSKLSAGQRLVKVFDGEDMYQVVTDQPVEQDDLIVYAKPGCVIPGTRQRAGIRKLHGVKSHGHICNAYEVGWQEEQTEEYLCIDEEWNMISGDVCPMAPPQGWIQQQSNRPDDAEEQSVPAFPEISNSPVKHQGDDILSGPDNPASEWGHAMVDGSSAQLRDQPQRQRAGANAGRLGSDTEEADHDHNESACAPKVRNAFTGLMGNEVDGQEDDNADDHTNSNVPNSGEVKAGAVNAFAGLMDSDTSDISDEEEPSEAAGNNEGSSKAANAFAGLMASDDDEGSEQGEVVATRPSPPGVANAIGAFAGLMGQSSDEEGANSEHSVEAPARVESFAALHNDQCDNLAEGRQDVSDPSKGTDVSALLNLAEAPLHTLISSSQIQEALKAEGISKARKQKLKQRLKKLQEADVSNQALVEIARVPGTMAVDELNTVEQVEAAMNTSGVSKTRKQKLKQRMKALQEASAGEMLDSACPGVLVDVPVDTLSSIEEVQAALSNPAASKTRKQKLKQRLKQLQEAAQKGKGKKVSAAVAAMQREVEERRKAADAARQEHEEKLRADEQARLQEQREAEIQEQAEQARAEAKRLERERLRKEGKLLTAKQRAEAKRLAAQREMFLARAQEVGIMTGDKPTSAQLEDRRRQAKKRQKELDEQRAKEKEVAEQAERERKRQAEKEAEACRRKEAEAVEAAKLSAEEAAADNWEDDVPDEWDASCEDAATAESDEQEGVDTPNEHEGVQGSQGEESSEDDSSQEDTNSESDWSTDSEEQRERRLEEARARRDARFKEAMSHRNKDDLRSPICCILGHVDTGKTKILDNIRRTNVQTGEAGGITQQIGATYIPADAVKGRTEDLRQGKAFDMKMPGLLVIDTPGHESFSNLRSRGSSLCDIAVLVVDVMHGLEQQTIESINLLKMRKSPFIIALNKIDRMYNWQAHDNAPVRDSLSKQEKATQEEFDTRCRDSMLALNEQGLNVELYWKNKDPRRFVNIVPTSAITGEGVCDLLWLIVKLTQNMMMDRLMFVEELQCTVLEVKVVEGYGHTIDAVLINGRIREGDKVVICGLQGPIITTVRSLLTPHPLKELRVKNTYVHHKEIKAAQGIKISAPNLESAVAGTQLFVVGKDDKEDELKDLVMEDMTDIFDKKEPEGVCVQASTLGSLEALLEFLSSDAVKIPVSGLNIGPVHKKDIMRANIMNEKKLKKYSCILAFDVPITREAQALAQSLGVTVFAADIIYHLFDMFTEYTQRCKAEEKSAAATKAVFPCRMRIVPNCVFNAKDPIVLGCEVMEGQLRMGTPITVPGKDCDLGKVIGLEKDHKAVESVERGESAAVKIEATNSNEASKLFGRHFVEQDELVSKISRESIDALKAHFRDEMTRPLWELIIKLKKVYKID